MGIHKKLTLGLALSVVALVHGLERSADESGPRSMEEVAIRGEVARQVKTFLRVEGVPGYSNVPGYAGWFEIDGFDFGVTAPLAFAPREENRELSVLSSVRAFGALGALQPVLLRRVATGKAFPTIRVEQAMVGGKKARVRLLSLTLVNAVALSIAVDPERSLPAGTQVASFEFERVTWTTDELAAGGKAGVTRSRGWNVLDASPR